MSLSIGNASQGMLRALHRTKDRLDRTFTHLATGKRIASASDDAAGLAISERMRATTRGLDQGQRNLADGYGYAATAEGTLQSSQDTLQRMRELAVQAGNGALNASDRATIQQEFDQLAASLDQNAPAAGSRTFTDGNGGEVAVDVADTSASGLGVAGLSLSDPNALARIDGAIENVAGARSSLGTVMNQLRYRSDVVGAVAETTEAARSRIADADFATELADLTRDRILQRLQLSGLAIVGRNNSATLDLLQ